MKTDDIELCYYCNHHPLEDRSYDHVVEDILVTTKRLVEVADLGLTTSGVETDLYDLGCDLIAARR